MILPYFFFVVKIYEDLVFVKEIWIDDKRRTCHFHAFGSIIQVDHLIYVHKKYVLSVII